MTSRPEEAPFRAKLRLVGALALTVGIAAIYASSNPEQTTWVPSGTREHLSPLASIALPLGMVVLAGDIWASSRGRGARPGGRVALLTDYIAARLPGWDEECSVRATRWRRGVSEYVRVDYPRASEDHDPTWRSRTEKMIATRLDAQIVSVKWTTTRRRFYMKLRALTATDRVRATVTNRISDVLAPLFRGVSVEATVPVWVDKLPEPPTVVSRTTPSGHASTAPDINEQQHAAVDSAHPALEPAATGTKPGEIRLTYGATTLDSSELFARRLELVSGVKFGGRWKVEFQPQKDLGILRPRAGFPQKIDHPGGRLLDFGDPRNPTLYYGRDENGTDHGWQLGAATKMPHSIYMGPTGGGKTTALRSLIIDAVMAGGTCFLADPKMIELSPFYGFPGCYVASSPAQIASMIDTMHALMMLRYQAILVARQQRKDVTKVFRPVLFFLDELLVARAQLISYWKEENNKGVPPWFSKMDDLAALARSAMVNLVIGVQRPDADLFDKGSRDNYRHRCALMRLSPQGSMMVWQNPYTGVDLPMAQGRCMASPIGESPIEMQAYWVPDPLTAACGDRLFLDYVAEEAAKRRPTEIFPVGDLAQFESAVTDRDTQLQAEHYIASLYGETTAPSSDEAAHLADSFDSEAPTTSVTRPHSMEELITGGSELDIADDGTLMSDQVQAGLLTKGDVFQTADGDRYSVDSIDEDFTADEIIVTTADGDRLTFGAMDVVERTLA